MSVQSVQERSVSLRKVGLVNCGIRLAASRQGMRSSGFRKPFTYARKSASSYVPPSYGITQPSAGKHKAWIKRLRRLPFNIFNRLKIFIVRIDFAETMIFHKDSIVGVNEINIVPRIKDKGVCKDIFIGNE